MSDSDEKRLEAVLTAELTKATNQEGARNILALLFPKAERVLRTFISQDADIAERKIERRISQRDFVAAYFALSPDTDSWGQTEFEMALKGSPTEAFDQLQRKVGQASPTKKSDIRRIFLELLESKFSSTQRLTEEWLTAIIEASPYLINQKDEDTSSFFSFDNEDRLRWVIVNGLRKLPADTQVSLLKSVIPSARDLSVLADISRTLVGDANQAGVKGQADWVDLGDEAAKLRELLVNRVAGTAENEAIWDQARPSNLLWFWWGAGYEVDVKEFTNRAMNSHLGLRKLLEITISEVKSTAGNYEQVSRTWEKIVDLEGLRDRAIAIISASKEESDVRLARRFLDALEKGREHPF